MEPIVTFEDLKLVNMFRRADQCLSSRIMDLWERNAILPRGVNATERIKQVVVAAVNSSADVVGVNTVYIDHVYLAGQGERGLAFHYRMFIEPRARRPHLMRIMTTMAMRIIEAEAKPDDPDHFVVVAENPGIAGRGMQALLKRIGLVHIGATPHRQLIFERKFR